VKQLGDLAEDGLAVIVKAWRVGQLGVPVDVCQVPGRFEHVDLLQDMKNGGHREGDRRAKRDGDTAPPGLEKAPGRAGYAVLNLTGGVDGGRPRAVGVVPSPDEGQISTGKK